MKWGIRHDPGHEGQQAKTKKIASLDKKFEKSIATANKGVVTPAFHNAAVSRMNARIRDLNDSDKYRNADLNKPGPLKDAYDKDAQAAIVRSFEDATREIYGSNASGTKKGVYNSKTDSIDIVDINVTHAADSPTIPDVRIMLHRDDNGLIASTELLPLTNEMMHFGVKGMKWGIRKSDSSGGSKASVSKEVPKAPANENPGAKYDRLRSQIKTHGANSLSQEDLNFVNARTEAIAKINKMNVASPGWLTDTSKVVLQESTKTLMKDLAGAAIKEYIAKPIIKSAIKGK